MLKSQRTTPFSLSRPRALASALRAAWKAALRREAVAAQANPPALIGMRSHERHGGRPRVLTDAKVQEILRWHEQKRAIRKILDSMKTLRQLARELGVSPATVSYVIARRGVYKQPSPEQRDAEIGKRRRRIAKLRERGFL